MGRKVHPFGFRLGVIKDSRSRWYAADKKTYHQLLIEDREIRKLIMSKVSNAGIGDVEIERYPGNVTVNVYTAKPGLVIGRKGATVSELRKKLDELTKKKTKLEVLEVTKPETNAQLIADSIAQQVLEAAPRCWLFNPRQKDANAELTPPTDSKTDTTAAAPTNGTTTAGTARR